MKKRNSLLLAALFLSLAVLLAACSKPGAPSAAETFTMTATVTAIGERLEVEVIEGSYGASGPYWVITPETTAYYNKEGKKIARSDLRPGDTVEIVYGGQVMMSYPPQVVARSIAVK